MSLVCKDSLVPRSGSASRKRCLYVDPPELWGPVAPRFRSPECGGVVGAKVVHGVYWDPTK